MGDGLKTLEQLNAEVGPLHDAVLIGIDVRWADGSVSLAFRTAGGPRRVVVEAFTRLNCPRDLPWGPSVSVNAVRLEQMDAGRRIELGIEMQSGDVLTIRGANIRAESAPPSAS